MKITKRQLRRIIKEAYTSLGLDVALGPKRAMHSLIPMAHKELKTCITNQSNCKGDYWYNDTFIVDAFIAEKTGVPVSGVGSKDVNTLYNDLYYDLEKRLDNAGLKMVKFEADL